MFNILENESVKKNELLSHHCTMRVGGKADYYTEPETLKQLTDVIKFCKKNNISYYIIGNGSNVIFSDSGYRGVIICTKKIREITVKNNIVQAETGVNLYVLNKFLINCGLSGMEWSYGIPGTLGGAVCMNAGAYGGQMKDVVLKAQVFDGKKTKTLYSNELELKYRDSIIKRQKLIVLKVWLKLNFKSSAEIEKTAKEYFEKRKLTQPLEYFNSGSIFKKYNEISSGKIIDNLGLKGVKINGAQISVLHANFIVNLGNATCEDIKKLIELIKKEVKQKNNIQLEEEVIFVGD